MSLTRWTPKPRWRSACPNSSMPQPPAAVRVRAGGRLPNTRVLCDPVAHDTAYTREAEPHVTGRRTRYRGPPAWVVTEEQHGWRAAGTGELIACPGYLVV